MFFNRLGLDEARILEMYNGGMSPVQIAKELGLKYYQPIYKFLQKTGNFVHHKHGNGCLRKYQVDETFFDVIDTEYKAYVLGFITADGYVDEKWNRIKISLNVQDVDILEKIKNAMGSTHPISYFVKDKKYNHCKLDLNSAVLVRRLKELGLYQGKSLSMTHEAYMHVPVGLQRHFLRGYFDGDGHVTYGSRYSSGVKYNITIIGTLDFLQNTYEPMFPSKNKIFKYKTCEMYGWRLSSKSNVENFLTTIYKDSNIFLARKHAVYGAHVKPGELLETQLGNQQPSLSNEEGSETIEKQPVMG